ncbi:unnamed protein product [Lampetra planeri]
MVYVETERGGGIAVRQRRWRGGSSSLGAPLVALARGVEGHRDVDKTSFSSSVVWFAAEKPTRWRGAASCHRFTSQFLGQSRASESRNTLRFAINTLFNLSRFPELKSCFQQELAADVLACYLDVPDAPCKLASLEALAMIATEQDLDIICNSHGAISLLTDMVNRPSFKKYTTLENIMYSSTGLVKTLTLVSITAGVRRKTLQPGAVLDEEALQEILPELREKLKVETERRDDGDVKKIEEAAKEFEKKTCVRFIPRSEEADYIYIHAWEGNWSFLGHQGGDQAMSLEPGKVTKGVVLHELMHVLGFHHEHCRSDRDDHVLVLSHNIDPGGIVDIKSNEQDLAAPYDCSSIMHYSMYALSSDYMSETITPTTAAKAPIGQRSGLSPLDVLRVQRKYQPVRQQPSIFTELTTFSFYMNIALC